MFERALEIRPHYPEIEESVKALRRQLERARHPGEPAPAVAGVAKG